MAFYKFPHAKDPGETLSYAFDFEPLVGDVEVFEPSCTAVVPDGETDNTSEITISNVVLDDKKVVCLVSGGVDGQKYWLDYGVKFGDKTENFQRTCILVVKER